MFDEFFINARLLMEGIYEKIILYCIYYFSIDDFL